jgi:hypothetical protein
LKIRLITKRIALPEYKLSETAAGAISVQPPSALEGLHTRTENVGRLLIEKIARPAEALLSIWERGTMRLRAALLAIAFVGAGCSPGEAGQNTSAHRATAADHHRCVKNGLKPGSANYAACRKRLAARRTGESGANKDAERSWWEQDPHEFACKFWGYKLGTAAFEDCLRRSELIAERQKKEEDCLKSRAGSITSLGGSSFIVNCPGGFSVNCPGNIYCPMCPGSFGCPK